MFIFRGVSQNFTTLVNKITNWQLLCGKRYEFQNVLKYGFNVFHLQILPERYYFNGSCSVSFGIRWAKRLSIPQLSTIQCFLQVELHFPES